MAPADLNILNERDNLAFMEKELKAAIHPDLEIVNVPIGMENKLEEF